MKRTLSTTTILFLLLLATVSCGAAPVSRNAIPAAAPQPKMAEDQSLLVEAPVAMEYAADESYAAGAETVPELSQSELAAAQPERVVIYTGSIALVVKDTRETVDQITALAEEQGGYVSNSSLYVSDDVLRGSISIRVMAEKYEAALARLRELAIRVENENTSSQDVTEEFTDLQARKTNLEATEEALQKLLEDRQKTGRTEDILEVYRELTNIRGQIEQIEGRLRYLSNQAALSTITIELIPHVLYQPVVVAGWEPRGVAKNAVQSLLKALEVIATIAIWFVVFGIPLLIVLAIPIVLLVVIIKALVRRRRRKKAAAAAKAEQSGS